MQLQDITFEKMPCGFGGNMYQDNTTGAVYSVNTCADMRLYAWRSVGGLVGVEDIEKVCAGCAGSGRCSLGDRVAGYCKWGDK